MNDRSVDTWNNGPVGMVIRFVLIIVGTAVMWFMAERIEAWARAVITSLDPVAATWLTVAALGVLAGLSFGLAVVLPPRVTGYRWVRAAVLGFLPLVAVVVGVFGQDPGRAQDLPDVLRVLTPFGGTIASQVLAAAAPVALGVALASGFAEPRRG